MEKKKSKPQATITIIIITWNVERTIESVLSTIEKQTYPKMLLEIIAVDGNSTDKTLDILKHSKLPIKIIQSPYPKDPEACRGVGLLHAKGDIVCFIDSDNFLPNENWLMHMVEPFKENPKLVGSETIRFTHRKKDNYLNRYFALIGSADPVGLYLGKADKLSYISDEWVLYGKIVRQEKGYFIVRFNPDEFPTLGSNGFCARRKLLLQAKSDPKHYFHIDVPLDLVRSGHTDFAVVKETIIHDTATSIISFIKKRIGYMSLHYQKRAQDRRYKVFDPEKTKDVIRIVLFIFFSLTVIQPLLVALQGYSRKKDIAWFIHPVFCFLIMSGYSYAIITKYIKRQLSKIF